MTSCFETSMPHVVDELATRIRRIHPKSWFAQYWWFDQRDGSRPSAAMQRRASAKRSACSVRWGQAPPQVSGANVSTDLHAWMYISGAPNAHPAQHHVVFSLPGDS